MSNNNKNYTLMDAKKAEEIVRSNVKRRRKRYCIKIYWPICYFCSFIFFSISFCIYFCKRNTRLFSTLCYFRGELRSKKIGSKGDLSPDSLYSGDARKLVLEALYKEINPKGRKQKKLQKNLVV